MNALTDPVKYLQQSLLAQRLTDKSSLSKANTLYIEQGRRKSFARLLLELHLVSDIDLASTLADLYQLPLLGDKDLPGEDLLQGQVAERYLREQQLHAIAVSDKQVQLAVFDPSNTAAIQAIAMATLCEVSTFVAPCSLIQSAQDMAFGAVLAAKQAVEADEVLDQAADNTDIDELRDLASEAPVIRLVNDTIQSAANRGASDIHLEPYANTLALRFRIDGVLQAEEDIALRHAAAVISRIKIMAGLDIAERRLPQDGRIRLRLHGRALDIRVSTLPTLHGESVVLRLLSQNAATQSLANIGFSALNRERIEAVLKSPNGMLLLTGPTGSGKTTTLYAALRELNNSRYKIITVEDPVEYQLQGVNQIHARADIGLGFANALRAIVRQDPDIIMVGEMRDHETASIAVQSALTGHLLLSTLHTNNACSAVTRLLDMGIEDYLLVSTLKLVVAQRLLRRLCDACKIESAAHEYPDFFPPERQLYTAQGCEHCHNAGYKGRIAIHEVLVIDDTLRALILQGAAATQLNQQARNYGMQSLFDDGLLRVGEGLTSMAELLRVTEAG